MDGVVQGVPWSSGMGHMAGQRRGRHSRREGQIAPVKLPSPGSRTWQHNILLLLHQRGTWESRGRAQPHWKDNEAAHREWGETMVSLGGQNNGNLGAGHASGWDVTPLS